MVIRHIFVVKALSNSEKVMNLCRKVSHSIASVCNCRWFISVMVKIMKWMTVHVYGS